MQSNSNNASGIEILGTRVKCPFVVVPEEFKLFVADQWAYVNFRDGDENHAPNSTAWIPLSIANSKGEK